MEGIAALLAAGFGGYKAWTSNSRLRAVKGTETSTVADLRAQRKSADEGAFRRRGGRNDRHGSGTGSTTRTEVIAGVGGVVLLVMGLAG